MMKDFFYKNFFTKGLSLLDQKLNHEMANCKTELKRNVVEELTEQMNEDKKELRRKMESDYSEVKRRLEVEATELRDKMQFDKKGLMVKFEEMEDEMQKEAKLVRWVGGGRWGIALISFVLTALSE